MFGPGQGLGAKGIPYTFAGGKAGIAEAAKRAKISKLTVGQELALMVAEASRSGQIKGGEVCSPAAEQQIEVRGFSGHRRLLTHRRRSLTQALAAILERLDELLEQMFGPGQGLGAKGIAYGFAGGKAGIINAAEHAKISKLTVGQELALMVAEANNKGGTVRS